MASNFFGRHKYKAQAVTIGGQEFPSKLEAAVFQLLTQRELAGEIRNIRRQASITLKEKCPECGDGPVIWKCDFSFEDTKTGNTIWCEAKGVETSDYKKRKRLWKRNPPGRLEIWKGSWQYPKLYEVIE